MDWQPEQHRLWRTVELESAGDTGRLADKKFYVEAQVRDGLEILFQHPAIAAKSQRPAVMNGFFMDIKSEVVPVLPVQTCDVVVINLGERLRHAVLLFD